MFLITPTINLPRCGMSDSDLEYLSEEARVLVNNLEAARTMIGFVSSQPDESLVELTNQIQNMLDNAINLKNALGGLKDTKDTVIY